MSLVKLETSFDPSNPEQLAAAMNFLSALGGNGSVSTGTPVTVPATTTEEPKKEAPKKRASRAKKPAETPETVNAEEKKETPSETPKTEQKAEKGITLEDIRSLTSKKAKDHREAIKAKITEWGANNVVQIPEDKFKEFMDFLNSL